MGVGEPPPPPSDLEKQVKANTEAIAKLTEWAKNLAFEVESPVELLEPRMDTIEPGSIEEVIIGGNRAVIFRNTAGPWASRQAMILVDGFIYTIVAQPFEPVRYPDGMPLLDRLWETVTESLVFFDPWK